MAERTMTWFSNLGLELNLLKSEEFQEPDQEVSADEPVVGILPNEMRAVWTLLKQYARAAAEAQVEVNFSAPDDRKDKIARFHDLNAKADFLNKLMWVSINDFFKIWEKPTTGLRQGWKVIASDKIPEQPFPGGFFRMG